MTGCGSYTMSLCVWYLHGKFLAVVLTLQVSGCGTYMTSFWVCMYMENVCVWYLYEVSQCGIYMTRFCMWYLHEECLGLVLT